MRLLSHMRTIICFQLDLYLYGITPWTQTSSSILQFSFTCGVAARAYSRFSPKIVQHARSRLGSLLIDVIPEPPVLSPQVFQPGPVVYLIFSLWHHHRYIGSTSDLSRRMRDHYRAAYSLDKPTPYKKLQRVHQVMRWCTQGSFCMFPLCTTKKEELERIETMYIHRLQPTMNVQGTTRGLKQLRAKRVSQWRMQQRRLQHPGYMASRLRTAHRTVLRETLGRALPPSVGRALVQRLQPVYDHGVNNGRYYDPYLPFPQHDIIVRPEYNTASHQCAQQVSMTVFSIATTHEVVHTSNLWKEWSNLLSRCPVDKLVHGFCALQCVITIVRRGSIAVRLKKARLHIWSPLTIVILRTGKTIRLPLQTAIRQLEDGRVVHVTCFFTSFSVRGQPDTIVLFYDIGRNPQRVNWTLRSYTMSDIISLWMSTFVIQSTPWKETVRGALRSHMRKTWHFDPLARPSIKIPCTDLHSIINSSDDILTMVLGQINVEPIFKQHFRSRARIIVASGRSIAQQLVNNIKFARESSMNQSRCTCVKLCAEFGITSPLPREHIAIRAAYIKDEEAASIFAINAMSVLYPNSSTMDSFFVNIVLSILTEFGRWIGRRFEQVPTSDGFDRAISIEAGYCLFPEWSVFQHIQQIVDAASQLGWLPGVQTWSHLKKLRDKIISDRSRQVQPTELPSADALRVLRARTTDCAVISSMDRNAGALFVECHQAYHSLLYNAFTDGDNTAYVVLPATKTQREVLDLWEALGKAAGIPGKFFRHGILPYAYVNRKHKDTSRFRPIVSFQRAPHRHQLRLCARAFYYIIRQLRLEHFTLWSAYDA